MTFSDTLRRHSGRFIFLAVALLLVCASLLIELSGVVYTKWNGCGVDSAGQVYIGRKSKILVYLDHEPVDMIYLPSFRSYMFTVSNDQILLSDGATKYTYDLQGHKLASEPDYGGRYYAQLSGMTQFHGDDGKFYTITRSSGMYRVRQSGVKLVYETAVISTILKTVTGICPILLMIAIILTAPLLRKVI